MVKQEVILELINLRQEGGYWDFKKEWYKSDNKGSKTYFMILFACLII